MNTLHSLALVSALTMLVGCSSTPKQEIVYTNSQIVEWKALKLKECRDQSVMITLTTYDMRMSSGEVMTDDEVKELQKWLADQCAIYYKLDV